MTRESVKDPRKTSDALQYDLRAKGIEISSSTIRRHLKEVGKKSYRPVIKQLPTKALQMETKLQVLDSGRLEIGFHFFVNEAA